MSSSTIRPIVAIAGGTGQLGRLITNALFSNTSSETAHLLASRGAKIIEVNYLDEQSILSAIHGVDVLINSLGRSVKGFPAKNALMEAAIKDGCVKLYFPSEYGIDHRLKDFVHSEWDKKAAHAAIARKSSMKVCAVYVGLFMETSFGPWYGMNTNKELWEPIGSANAPVAFTALEDAGKAIASLARLPPSEVPDHVRIVGDNISLKDASEAMTAVSGNKIELKEIELGPFKAKTTERTEGDPAEFIRFVMGEGKLDFTQNENELVNPGEKLWKWKTVKDYAKEVDGKPWIEYGDWIQI